MHACSGLGSSDEMRLIQNLFKDYNPLIRPVRNLTGTVHVKFGMAMIQLINVVSKSHHYSINSINQRYSWRHGFAGYFWPWTLSMWQWRRSTSDIGGDIYLPFFSYSLLFLPSFPFPFPPLPQRNKGVYVIALYKSTFTYLLTHLLTYLLTYLLTPFSSPPFPVSPRREAAPATPSRESGGAFSRRVRAETGRQAHLGCILVLVFDVANHSLFGSRNLWEMYREKNSKSSFHFWRRQSYWRLSAQTLGTCPPLSLMELTSVECDMTVDYYSSRVMMQSRNKDCRQCVWLKARQRWCNL